MAKNDFPLKVFYVPVNFSDMTEAEEREKFIIDLIELKSCTLIKARLTEQSLHNLFILANYLQNKIQKIENKPSLARDPEELDRIKTLLKCVKSQFNEQIKVEHKSAIIQADAHRYLVSLLDGQPQHKIGFLNSLVNRMARIITGEDYMLMYEYYHNFNMQEMQKTILLKKFSTLSENDKITFLTTLFNQPPDIIKKVICTQSLDDLDKLRKQTLPDYKDKLDQLGAMINEYEMSVKQSSPDAKAEKYLNANKHLLKEIAKTPGDTYEKCKIDQRNNIYVVHLMTDVVKISEEVHERVILHYAIEHLKESNLVELKESLFPKPQASQKYSA